jgi:dipeptidyl aminopeptidase/acylaminoacyl peptidase
VYGWDHIEAARRNQDKHERDYDDIAAGIEEACRHTSVDRSRIVLMGHSYGATLVNWIVTQTHAFRAAVSFDGHVDFTYAWGTHRIAGTGSLTFEYLLDGTPWEAEVNYRRYSALPHLAKARTPCLLITAGRGVLSEYELMFTTLKRRGIDVELLHYPDEDHTLRRRANQQDLVERTVDWLEARLHPPS